MAGVTGVIAELMLQVDTDNPITREVTLKLNELADVVASGAPEVRKSALEMGAYAVVCRAWIYCCYSGSSTNTLAPGAKQCRNAILRALFALTPGNPDIIDDVGWQIIVQAVDKYAPEQTQILVLRLLRNIFIRSEENREQFCWNLDMLEPLLSLTSKPRVSNAFLLEWCSTLKALILCDDVREASNRSSERKRAIANAKVLPNLASRLSLHLISDDDDGDVAAMNSIVILLSSMAVNDDLCLSIESGNAIPGIHNLFKKHFQNKTLMRNTVSLLRYLCVNGEVREKVTTFALMKYVVDILNHYIKSKPMVEVTMYCCAYMTLNSSCHVAQFIVKGGLQTMLKVMKNYLDDVNILKPACLTIRNVSESGDEFKDKLKEVGYSMFLNKVMEKVPQLREFYILPILRDLGFSSTSLLEELVRDSVSANVAFEPKPSRKSVIVDEWKLEN